MKKVNIDFDVDQFKAQVQEDNEMADKLLRLMFQSFPPTGDVPQIIITIRDGILENVISSAPIKYVLVDYDNLERGDTEFPTEINYHPTAVVEDIYSYLETLKYDIQRGDLINE